MKKHSLVVAALALAAGLMATGCNNPSNDTVTIHYKQLGSCNGFNNGGGVTSVGPNRAYATFRISTIENKDTAARDFNFDPNQIYIDQSPRAFTSTHLNLSQFNPFYATARLVPKGTTTAINGAVIAVVSTSAADGASEANKTSYMLLYNTPAGGQGVVLVKDNPSQTTWPSTPDCTTIIF
ncbi:MAG TPA: hypothetical protein VGH73_13740 [Thermoanaerobaculia bacterium]|jgi:hypothetical protein